MDLKLPQNGSLSLKNLPPGNRKYPMGVADCASANRNSHTEVSNICLTQAHSYGAGLNLGGGKFFKEKDQVKRKRDMNF